MNLSPAPAARKSVALRDVLARFLLGATLVALLFGMLASLYVSSRNASLEQDHHFEALNVTIGELTKSSIQISDFSETQRLLGLVNGREGLIVAVTTVHGDLLMADYSALPLVRSYFSFDEPPSHCKVDAPTEFRANEQSYRIYCTEIYPADQATAPVRPLGLVLSFKPVSGAVLPTGSFISELALVSGAILLALLFIRLLMNQRFVRPLERLTESVERAAAHPLHAEPGQLASVVSDAQEFSRIRNAYSSLLQNFRREHQKRKESEKKEALFNLATQIAHDIRSPLAALEMVSSQLPNLPEEQRLLVRSAVSRIKDIANNLLDKNRRVEAANAAGDAPTELLLASTLEALVTEKRIQYRNRLQLRIELQTDPTAHGAFVNVASSEIKRVLSNLIDNSAEAIDTAGEVRVRVEVRPELSDRVMLTIFDNGKGIPTEFLPQLMQKGATHGKANGSGLGLHYAKQAVETWGGSIAIESTLGEGTQVRVTLPRAKEPSWFVSRILLHAGSRVVILDDDTSIHQIWTDRFERSGVLAAGVTLSHFSSAAQLIRWAKGAAVKEAGTLYLVDYELLNEAVNGLEVIESLGIAARSILVTSRFEEREIRARAQAMGVRMIPKGMAGFTPIMLSEGQQHFDAILIDDDPLIHLAWNSTARRLRKKLAGYEDVRGFMHRMERIDRSTPIYIDSNLGDEISGEEAAKAIFDAGFDQIYLATGHSPDHFTSMPWLRGVVGKEPPWNDGTVSG